MKYFFSLKKCHETDVNISSFAAWRKIPGYKSGLPDGFFSNPNPQFGQILEGLRLENVDIPILWPFGIFYRHLGCFMTIRYICVPLVHIFRFWYHVPRKIWQPWYKCRFPSGAKIFFEWGFYEQALEATPSKNQAQRVCSALQYLAQMFW
jgi:hypothetical protein